MKTQPKYKVCRRLGPGIYDKCQTDKYVLATERRNAKRGAFKRPRRSGSNYGQQLLEKQKVRFTYGITEKQFSNYVASVLKDSDSNPVEKLYEALESRLDNVVYRTGLSASRRGARQLVSHGHITVNGKKVKIPSYSVNKGDDVSVRENSKSKPVFELRSDILKERSQPSWLSFDLGTYKAKILAVPGKSESLDLFDLNSVLEFYRR